MTRPARSLFLWVPTVISKTGAGPTWPCHWAQCLLQEPEQHWIILSQLCSGHPNPESAPLAAATLTSCSRPRWTLFPATSSQLVVPPQSGLSYTLPGAQYAHLCTDQGPMWLPCSSLLFRKYLSHPWLCQSSVSPEVEPPVCHVPAPPQLPQQSSPRQGLSQHLFNRQCWNLARPTAPPLRVTHTLPRPHGGPFV